MEHIYSPLHNAAVSFGATDLFDYLKLTGEWTVNEAEKALAERRKWAQGQRSNPKFSDESKWFIRSLSEISEIIKAPATYTDFIQNLSEMEPNEVFADHYENLGVSPSASVSEIEQAHRERYRETRTLLQSEDSHHTYRALDEAWTVLSNPLARSAYDVTHRVSAGVGLGWDLDQGHERRAEGFLGPHSGPSFHENFQYPGEEKLRRKVSHGPNYRFNKSSVTLPILGTPTTILLKIKKSGSGQQPARLFTDSKWLRVSPTHIDPSATSQTITVTSSPRFMTSNRALAKLTLETADRQRTSVAITGKRNVLSRFFRWTIAFIIIFFSAAMFWVSDQMQATHMETELELLVTPEASSIYLDGENFGGGSARTFTGVPHNTPISIVVESPDFETWRQRVIVTEGEARSVEITLQRVEQ
jgi:curved DNA-binding protein CbpA